MTETLDKVKNWKLWLAPVWRRLPHWIKGLLARYGPDSFRVAVAAVCVNPQGKMLLLNHRYREGDPWGIPGGLLKHGEEPTEGVVREIFEETGLNPTLVELLLVQGEGAMISLIYYLRVADEEPELQEGEIRSYRWVSLTDPDLRLAPTQSKAAQLVRERLERGDEGEGVMKVRG